MAIKTDSPKYQEKLRYWKLARGAHKLKNRSSKHLRLIQVKDIYRCLSNDALQEMAKNDNFDAYQEINRRANKRAKREAKA